jgi:hypothetical protein
MISWGVQILRETECRLGCTMNVITTPDIHTKISEIDCVYFVARASYVRKMSSPVEIDLNKSYNAE